MTGRTVVFRNHASDCMETAGGCRKPLWWVEEIEREVFEPYGCNDVEDFIIPPLRLNCPWLTSLLFRKCEFEKIKTYGLKTGSSSVCRWHLDSSHTKAHLSNYLLWIQTIKAIVDSCSFKSLKSDEPRRVQVLDLYCLTRFESKSSSREIVY